MQLQTFGLTSRYSCSIHWQVYGRKCKVGPYESSTNLSSQIPKDYSLGGSQGMPQFNKLSGLRIWSKKVHIMISIYT